MSTTTKPARKTTPEAAAKAKAAREAKAAQAKAEATAQAEAKAQAAAAADPRPECACGCGERTRGGTYRPGHDAKAKSAALAIVRGGAAGDVEAARQLLDRMNHDPSKAAPRSRACECDCGGQTRGGRFLPGHDAKLKGRLLAAAVGGDAAAERELAERGWGHFLAASLAKAARKAAPAEAK